MQQILTARGYYHDKIDGKAGMQTRAALGDYQKRNGLKVDCWPTAAVLAADASERALAGINRCPARLAASCRRPRRNSRAGGCAWSL